MTPTVLIAGAGRTGLEIARRLAAEWRVIVVDCSSATLATLDLGESVVLHEGDATSAIVLKEAGIEGVAVVVAATASDEKNLEVLRLARDRFGVSECHAVIHDLGWEERYRSEGVQVVDRFRACAAQVASRVRGGHRVVTEVGLGQGEILEVRVPGHSSVVGQRLFELQPRHWRVAAIYRDDRLILPGADAEIRAGDRVLVVGDPEILASIATFLTTGESRFPLQYGAHVVVAGAGRLAELSLEASYLMGATAAMRLDVVVQDDEEDIERARELCAGLTVPASVRAVRASSLIDLVDAAGSMDAGLALIEPQPLSLWGRIGLARSPLAQAIDRLSAPALIARGTYPYRRVLLVLADRNFRLEAARLAIDLVRMTRSELYLGIVHQPELVTGLGIRGELEERGRQVVELARAHKVSVTVRTMEGNPVQEVVSASSEYDLLVLPCERNKRAFLTRPDVGQNIMHRAACSTLVMPCSRCANK